MLYDALDGTTYSAALQAATLVYEAIAATGKEGAPRGVIYAALMEQGCTLEQYTALEQILIRSGLVEKKQDLLFAATPGGAR